MTFGLAARQKVMEATNLADLYRLPPLDWARIEARLDQGMTQAPETGGPDRHTCWLATIDRDGTPHLTGVGALWVDERSGSRPAERHAKPGTSLATRCTLSVSTASSTSW